MIFHEVAFYKIVKYILNSAFTVYSPHILLPGSQLFICFYILILCISIFKVDARIVELCQNSIFFCLQSTVLTESVSSVQMYICLCSPKHQRKFISFKHSRWLPKCPKYITKCTFCCLQSTVFHNVLKSNLIT